MKWNFPVILTTRTADEQFKKVEEECNEYLTEVESGDISLQDKEAIDVLHSVETFLRLRFKGREQELDNLIQFTIEKNSKRGYYESSCY